MARESQLEAHLRKAVRTQLGGHTSKLAPVEAGIPDRLVILPGGHLELIELKTETGRLRPAQRLWHQRAADLGVTVTVLSGRAEIDQWIAQHEHR